MKNDNKSKRNIFGSVYNTPGQNIYAAVTDMESDIGIPPYHYDEVLEIFKRALRPNEVDLLCRGFGLLRPRQSQKEIAADLHVKGPEVSYQARICTEKLKRSPYKMELKSLCPSAEDLFTEIVRLRTALAYDNAAKINQTELEHRLANTQAALGQTEASRAQLMAENARLTHDLEGTNKLLRAADEVNRQANNALAKLYDRLAAAESFHEQVEKIINETFANAKADLRTKISRIQPAASGIISLNLSKDTMQILKNVHIDTLWKLSQQSHRTLSGLRVPQSTIEEIVAKLKERGLSLRA